MTRTAADILALALYRMRHVDENSEYYQALDDLVNAFSQSAWNKSDPLIERAYAIADLPNGRRTSR